VKSNTSFRSIWLSNATSELGGAAYTACNSIVIFQLTGSTTALGSVWLIYYISSFFMQLFIGPYVDRWSRKWTMISCQLIRMLLASIFVVSLLMDSYTIAFIYMMQIIIGMIMPIFVPANQAILPTILHKEKLERANASLDSVRQVMVILGPIMAGVFVDYLAVEWVLIIIAFAFLCSALMLLTVTEDYHREKIRRPWIVEFREGVKAYFNHRLIVWLGVFFGFVQFGVGVTIVTTIPFITTILDEPYSAYGVFMGGFPIGYTLGALISKRIGNVKGLGILFSALFIGGCTYLSLGFTPWLSLAIITEVIAGMVIAIFNIYNITWIQRLIPNHVMGKVTSVRLLIMRTMMPLGILFATVAAPFLPIRIMYIVIGCVICITSFGGYLYLRKRDVMELQYT
jgi:MFS family permease